MTSKDGQTIFVQYKSELSGRLCNSLQIIYYNKNEEEEVEEQVQLVLTWISRCVEREFIRENKHGGDSIYISREFLVGVKRESLEEEIMSQPKWLNSKI